MMKRCIPICKNRGNVEKFGDLILNFTNRFEKIMCSFIAKEISTVIQIL